VQRKTVEAAGRTLRAAKFLSPEEAEEYLTSSQEINDVEHPPVDKAMLKPTPHATAILAVQSLAMFDVARAHQEGLSAYCVTMGLAPKIAESSLVNPEAFRDSIALIMGVISTHELVRDANGGLLPIYSVGSPAK
jgi:hypothetical protein